MTLYFNHDPRILITRMCLMALERTSQFSSRSITTIDILVRHEFPMNQVIRMP